MGSRRARVGAPVVMVALLPVRGLERLCLVLHLLQLLGHLAELLKGGSVWR